MKKSLITMLAVAFVLALALPVLAGNGAPSGAHYNLNIIGVDNPKNTDMTDSNRHTIFVSMTGTCKIMLTAGEFKVLDGNGTDGTAKFQLPNPDPDNDGTTEYSVYARALGKPGGTSTTRTCAHDDETNTDYCSNYSMVLTRDPKGGKSVFTNVSKELLYIYVDTDGDGVVERYNLFNEKFEEYWWEYVNTGLKLAQLRFYEIATTVDPGDEPPIPDPAP